MASKQSIAAKKRWGNTKEERSATARRIALIRSKKMTKKQRSEHAKKMAEAKYGKK